MNSSAVYPQPESYVPELPDIMDNFVETGSWGFAESDILDTLMGMRPSS